MASFKDIIPQFTPYVQQLPVEDMVKVGMYKQQLYDQGVQKIQSQIDSVAGLDIMHDSDKKYLQSKLNELGNNLKTVAAADFSNFQLVNSVSGMTTQIVKDKNIQNAVGSTSWIREQNKLMEKAVAEGKSSPQNMSDWNNKVNEYLSSEEVGQNFRGRYIQYTDIEGKLRELFNKMKESPGYTIDDPYKRDKDGNVIGYDFDMISRTVKGTSAEKILNNFYDSLDENDKQQLMIDAKYHYRGSNIDALKTDLVETASLTKKNISDEIAKLTTSLQSKDLSAKQRGIIEGNIKELNDRLTSNKIDNQLQETLDAINNPETRDGALFNIYTKKTLTNLASDLATQTISEEHKTNPAFQGYMEMQRYNFDVQKEITRKNEWVLDYGIRKETLGIALRKEQKELEKEQEGKKPIVSIDAKSTEINTPSIYELGDSINSETSKINKDLFDLGSRVSQKGTSDKQKIINANKVLERYYTDPYGLHIDNQTRELIEGIVDRKRSLSDNINIYKQATAAGKAFDPQIKEAFKSQKGLTVGNSHFTAQELYTFYNSAYAKYHSGGELTSAGGAAVRTADIISPDILKKYKNTKYYSLAKAMYNHYNPETKKSYNDNFIISHIQNIQRNVGSTINGIVTKQSEVQKKAIEKYSPNLQNINIAINGNNKNDMHTISQAIGLKLNQYNTYGNLDNTFAKDFNPDAFNELTKSKSSKYIIVKNPDGGATIKVTDGKSEQKIPLTSTEFSNWFPQYSQSNIMTSVNKSIMATSNKTTNLNNTINPASARFHGYDNIFASLNSDKELATRVRVDVEGSKYNIGDGNDKYQIRIYYNGPDGWKNKILNNEGYKNTTDTYLLLQQIGPKTINDMFNTK